MFGVSMASVVWNEGEGRGLGLVAVDSVDDACGVATVLAAVGSVELIVEVAADIDEADVFVDAAGPDVPLVAGLGAPVPGSGWSVTDRT
jgi:hypothetical protein